MNKKNIVMMVMVLLFVNVVSASLFYELELFYENGEVEVKSKEVIFSHDDLTRYNVINDYYFERHSVGVVDRDGRETKVEYGVLNKAYGDGIRVGVDVESNEEELFEEGGLEEFDVFTFNLYLPYSEEDEELIFYDVNGEEIGRDELEGIVNEVDVDSELDKGIEKVLGKDVGNRLSKYWVLVLILVVLIGVLVWLIVRERK
tara:strand:- start:163 stop:768 length:606 start_codon:yes stop_codon:yes gene_type:complete